MGEITMPSRAFEELAVRTLGKNSVVTSRRLKDLALHYDPRVREWEGVPFGVETVSCSKNVEVILGDCAEQNKGGDCDWRVFSVRDLSLIEQREILGADPSRQPCFRDNGWWLDRDWAAESSGAGYYLVNVIPFFTGMSWWEQREAIKELGDDYSRCPEEVISEVAISDAIVFKRKVRERILYDCHHLGCSVTSVSYHVGVGHFDDFGLCVGPYWDYSRDNKLGVVVTRKF